jgi:cytidyltransferase-like protein
MNKFKTVYIAGCWDYCHKGHVNILNAARSMGDFLIVAVNSDRFIMDYKKIQMDHKEGERVKAIMNLKIADLVFILEDYESQSKYIDIIKPSIIVHGSDWSGEDLYKQMNISKEQIDLYGIEFKYPEYTHGISSTILRQRSLEDTLAFVDWGIRNCK